MRFGGVRPSLMPTGTPRWTLAVRTGLALGVVLWSLAVSGAPPAHFYFVQITDTHWGARDGVSLTRKVAEAINQLPHRIEFVVHTGDLFADSLGDPAVVRESLKAMKAIKVPVFYVPGNHDILPADEETMAALYRRHFGALSSRTDVQGVVCLFFYSEPLIGRFSVSGYDPLAWLETQFKQAGGKPVILFQHAPSVGSFLDSGDPAETEPDSYRAWETLVRRYPALRAVIAGHVHRDELHWLGGVPIYVSAPVARFWDRQPSFRVYDYWDGKLGYTTIYLQGGGKASARKPAPDSPSKEVRSGKE